MSCHERLKYLKDGLLCCVEAQMGHLEDVDANELGEAIDMLKDLEEAIYYCTITEAMNGESKNYRSHNYEVDFSGTDWGTSRDTMYYSGDTSAPTMNKPMDEREGRSHHSRKTYMEARETHQDKAMQLRELEKYMQELSTDMVEMIQDASPEEKQYLEKKITTLAAKIGQMK